MRTYFFQLLLDVSGLQQTRCWKPVRRVHSSYICLQAVQAFACLELIPDCLNDSVQRYLCFGLLDPIECEHSAAPYPSKCSMSQTVKTVAGK